MKKIFAAIINHGNERDISLIESRLSRQTVKPEEVLVLDSVAEAMAVCEPADYVLCISDTAIPKNTHLVENLYREMERDAQNTAMVYARLIPKKNAKPWVRYYMYRFFHDEKRSAIELAAETNNGKEALFCGIECMLFNRSLYGEIGEIPDSARQEGHIIYAAKALKCDKDILYVPSAEVTADMKTDLYTCFCNAFIRGLEQKKHSYILKDFHRTYSRTALYRDAMRHLRRRKEYGYMPAITLYALAYHMGEGLGTRYRSLPKIAQKKLLNKRIKLEN